MAAVDIKQIFSCRFVDLYTHAFFHTATHATINDLDLDFVNVRFTPAVVLPAETF